MSKEVIFPENPCYRTCVPAPSLVSEQAPVSEPVLIRSYSHALLPLNERPLPSPVATTVVTTEFQPLPRMQYNLGLEEICTVYDFIARCTNNFTTLNPEFSGWLQHRMRDFGGKSVVAGALPAPCRLDVLRSVIGKNGYFFKRTTETWKVFFIWHDLQSNSFIFWGPNNKAVVRAMDAIRWRIRKFTQQCPKTPSLFLKTPHFQCWDNSGVHIINSAECTNRPAQQQQQQQQEQEQEQQQQQQQQQKSACFCDCEVDGCEYSDMPALL